MRNIKGIHLTQLAIALSLALPLAVGAQNTSTNPSKNNAAQRPATTDQRATGSMDGHNLSAADRKFLKEAAIGGMAEVELGRVAVQNAVSDQVRQFGQRMVDDHGKGNDELKSLAQSEGVSLPAQLDTKHRQEVQRMKKLSGAQFDREYMKMMVEDHHQDIRAFQQEADHGQDADVKAFAAKILPTLKDHLAMAEQTNNMVARGGGKAKGAHDATAGNDASGATQSERNRDSTVEGQNRPGPKEAVKTNPPETAPNSTAKGTDASSGNDAARNRDSTEPAQEGKKQ